MNGAGHHIESRNEGIAIERLTPSDPKNVTLSVLTSEEAFFASKEDWQRLTEASNATLYQSFDWNWLWWQHLGRQEDRTLHILMFHDHGNIVGIMPLFVEHFSIAGIIFYRKLGMLGTGTAFTKSFGIFSDDGPSDYLDLIVLPGYEIDVTEFIVKYLDEQRAIYDEAEFLNVPEGSSLATLLVPRLKRNKLHHRYTRSDINSRVMLPDSLSEYLGELSPHVRRRFTQARQASGPKHVFRIQDVGTQDELSKSFHEMRILHQKRWNDMGYPGYFSDLRFLEFQLSMASEMLKQQRLWFKTTWVNGQCVAARLGYIINNSIYDYLTGFDKHSAAAKYRPGYALLLSMMEDAITTRCTSVELLRGSEKYKAELNHKSFYNLNLVVGNLHSLGSTRTACYALIRICMFLWFLVSREMTFLRVQYAKHGFFTFVYHWATFRIERLINKIGRSIEQQRGNETTYKDDLRLADLIDLVFIER